MTRWETFAKRLDQFRIIPRVALIAFFVSYVFLVKASWSWYTGLDLAEVSATNLALITAFPITLLSAIGGMFTSIYKHYQEGGYDWHREGSKDAP